LTSDAIPRKAAGERPELAKTLSVGQAIGLGITIVVGSGLLILPGLAYQQAHGAAIYAWLVDGLLVVPLLVVFSYLGSRFPSAGGIAGFVQAAFGRVGGGATEVLLLGTFSLGIPAIAITGANYAMAAVGGGDAGRAAATLLLLLLAGGLNWMGARISGRAQQALAVALVGLIAAVGVLSVALADPGAGTPIAPPSEWTVAIPSLGAVFFAFTGWEMLSFTTEEYRNPRRDFPIAVGGSFVAVLVLYVLVAVGIQRTLNPGDAVTRDAPIAGMLATVLGTAAGRAASLLGVVIIAANLVGASWAASRLVFSSAREGLLPAGLRPLHPVSRTPRRALAAVMATFAAVCALQLSGLVSLDSLLALAGQNFFILYGLSVVALLKLADRLALRVLGVAALVLVVLTMGTFGWGLLYAGGLLALGGVLAWARS
jgi:amino acid efflux transporter